MKSVQDVIEQVRVEYLDMPRLRLKPAQVQRLCGIDPRVCHLVLDSLVESKFLQATADGHYARLTEGLVSQPQPGRATPGIPQPSAKAS